MAGRILSREATARTHGVTQLFQLSEIGGIKADRGRQRSARKRLSNFSKAVAQIHHLVRCVAPVAVRAAENAAPRYPPKLDTALATAMNCRWSIIFPRINDLLCRASVSS